MPVRHAMEPRLLSQLTSHESQMLLKHINVRVAIFCSTFLVRGARTFAGFRRRHVILVTHGALVPFWASLTYLALLVHVPDRFVSRTLNCKCAGPSMMPTFNMSGDVIFVEKISSRNGTLDRGDVVIAMTPQNAKLKVCKRIIGLVRAKFGIELL